MKKGIKRFQNIRGAERSVSLDGAGRALIDACTAVDTGVRVDDGDVSDGDC